MQHRVLNPERMKWTPELDKQLLDLFAQGLHKNEVADRLGASIAATDARRGILKRKGQAK